MRMFNFIALNLTFKKTSPFTLKFRVRLFLLRTNQTPLSLSTLFFLPALLRS